MGCVDAVLFGGIGGVGMSLLSERNFALKIMYIGLMPISCVPGETEYIGLF